MITFLLSLGCSKRMGEIEPSNNLKDAYFIIAEAMENDIKLDKEDIETILKNFMESKNQTDDKVFSVKDSDDEGLIVRLNANDTLKNIEYINKKDKSVRLYSGLKSDQKGLYVKTKTKDLLASKKVEEELDIQKTDFLEIYEKIQKNVETTNDLTIEEIKKHFTVKPEKIEDEPRLEDSRIAEYIFREKDEDIRVIYLKESNKVISIYYRKHMEDGYDIFKEIDTTIDKEETTYIVSNDSRVKNTSVQRSILNILE